MTLGPVMNQSWQPIVFVELTEFPTGNTIRINLQSIESITEVPEVDVTKSPAFKGMNGPLKTRPAEPAHTVVVSKSGVFYNVKESYDEIIRRSVKLMKMAVGE